MIVLRAPNQKAVNKQKDGWIDGWMMKGLPFGNSLVHGLVLCLQGLPSFPLREAHSFILILNLNLSFREPHLQSTKIDLSIDFIAFLLQGKPQATLTSSDVSPQSLSY